METQQLLKTLTLYFDGKCEILHGSSGMNNLIRFIRHESGEYVMRVYQNHADVSRILVEQAVLDQLQVLPVPRIVLTKDGQTMAKVGEKLAVVFEFKKGQNLKLERIDQYVAYGKMVGQLSVKLRDVFVGEGEYLPYYELEKSYPMVKATGLVQELLEEVKGLMAQFKALPHQLIHGDINCSNMLMDDLGMPCAILDFEFVTWDLRAMEVAICLSELLQEDDYFNGLKAFCEGYKSVVSLTEAEILMIPWLIRLRRLDVMLHFLERHERGIETEAIESELFLQKQLLSLQKQHQWLVDHGGLLMEYLR